MAFLLLHNYTDFISKKIPPIKKVLIGGISYDHLFFGFNYKG